MFAYVHKYTYTHTVCSTSADDCHRFNEMGRGELVYLHPQTNTLITHTLPLTHTHTSILPLIFSHTHVLPLTHKYSTLSVSHTQTHQTCWLLLSNILAQTHIHKLNTHFLSLTHKHTLVQALLLTTSGLYTHAITRETQSIPLSSCPSHPSPLKLIKMHIQVGHRSTQTSAVVLSVCHGADTVWNFCVAGDSDYSIFLCVC